MQPPSPQKKYIPNKINTYQKKKNIEPFLQQSTNLSILSIHENRNDQANPLSLGHKLAVIYIGGEKKNGRFPSKRLSSGGTNEADSRGREESSAGAENGSAGRLQGGGRATSFVDFIYDSM